MSTRQIDRFRLEAALYVRARCYRTAVSHKLPLRGMYAFPYTPRLKLHLRHIAMHARSRGGVDILHYKYRVLAEGNRVAFAVCREGIYSKAVLALKKIWR